MFMKYLKVKWLIVAVLIAVAVWIIYLVIKWVLPAPPL